MSSPALALNGNRAYGGHLPPLVVLSHLRWNFVVQRPQHLMMRAAASRPVLFWEEFVWADCDAPTVTLTPTASGVTVAVPQIPRHFDARLIEAAVRDQLEATLSAWASGAEEPVLWFYTPMMLRLTDRLRPSAVIYDCMDELSAFRGAPGVLPILEQELLARADIVFTGGRSLYEAKRRRHPQVHCFPSSVDAAHFATARVAQADPADQAGIPSLRIGFFGVIDERMDTALLAALADAEPSWHFVMLGPVVKIDPADLPQRPNIHWLGSKQYAELPGYLAGWQLGFMPFALNESTRFISPTKTPEFLSAGLPLVSTPIADVVRDYGKAGLVEIADGAEAFRRALGMLLERPREAWLRRVDRRLAAQSWDATWTAMAALIEQALQREARPATGLGGDAAAARAEYV